MNSKKPKICAIVGITIYLCIRYFFTMLQNLGMVYLNGGNQWKGLEKKGEVSNKAFEARTLSEEVRTVLYNEEGAGVILTLEEVKRGKRLFNVACGSCHVGGLTKTNPNVGLDIASLNSALPPRNNISSLVDFLNSPKSYDGFQSISEIHPGIESCDLFPKMRTLTREDLVAISGHILLQTKILNERWGGGKIYY